MPEELKRALGLGYTTLFGVGLILGAGIYVLIGRAAQFAGDAIWLSVLFASFIAITTGFSYAELSSIYPTAASTHTYVEKAFPQKREIASLAAWLIYFEGVAGAATAAVGFARYFSSLLSMNVIWIPFIAIIMISITTFINWYGIEESATLTVIFTFVEAGGLLFVSFLGFAFTKRNPQYLTISTGFNPVIAIMLGAALFYFAFTGFELQPTLSEEAKEPKKTIPKAIILALLFCSLIYLLVAIAVVRLLSPELLAESNAPLADAAMQAWTPSYSVLMFIALFSTSNTVLGFLVASSRLLYGLAEEGIFSEKLARVDSVRRTPYISVIITGVIAVLTIVIALYLPEVTGWEVAIGNVKYKLIDIVGKTASLACLLAFMLVNASAVALRFLKPDEERGFKIPLSIGKVPILPIISNILILVFIITSFLDWITWVSIAIVGAIGLILMRR